MLGRKTICSLVLLLGASMATSGFVRAETSYIPLQFRTVSGIRPFANIVMNGQTFLLMVHSSADFNLMITHANAKKASVVEVVHQDTYGIQSPGHVSELGREKAIVPKLEIAGHSLEHVAILVFEIPQDPPVDGILGVRLLREQKMILDFDKQRLGVPSSLADSEREDRRLVAEGFVPHQLNFNALNDSYEISGRVNGHQAVIAISTVGQNIIDSGFAKDSGIALGPVIDRYGGPKGSQGDVYIAKSMVDIVVDQQRVAPDRPHILDTYAYDSMPRATAPDSNHVVRLAADFLLANQAVIDFGTNTLFLRPASITGATCP